MSRPRPRLGVKLPGQDLRVAALAAAAREAEQAGLDSVWVSDHVLMPERIDSDYPFAADRRARWDVGADWFDAVVVLSAVAAATERVRLGTAVLIAPLRQPVVLATQWASLDRLAAGRTLLGVGVGWLAEEFDALGLPFRSRGAMTEEWVQVVRACWTGRPAPFDGEHYRLPAGLVVQPAPARTVPILVGGASPAALRRAVRHGDGWVGHADLADLDVPALAASVAHLDDELAAAGRSREAFTVVLRLVGSAAFTAQADELVPALAAAGVDELVLDWPERGCADLYAAVHNAPATPTRTEQR